MSNYLPHILIKQFDVTTDPDKPEKKFVFQYFHPILNEGEDDNKKIDIEAHHVEHYLFGYGGVMMARVMQGNV